MILTMLLVLISITINAQKGEISLEKNGTAEPLNFDEDVSCIPAKLDIIIFRDAVDGASGKTANQVVVGRDIFYQGKPGRATNWQWKFNSMTKWTSFSGTGKSGRGQIATIDLPTNNADFGDTHGEVKVSASLNGIPPLLSTDPCEGWKAKVFFLKDDMNHGPPNWFYYWKQVPPVVAALQVPGIKLYNTQTCAFERAIPITLKIEYDLSSTYTPGGTNTNGSNRLNSSSIGKTDLYGTPCDGAIGSAGTSYMGIHGVANTIVIKKGAGYAKPRMAIGTASAMVLEGVHNFYSTVAHEAEHAKIFCEVWANGYSPSFDRDNDGYRDSWEATSKTIAGMTYMFNSNNTADKYVTYQGNPLIHPSVGVRYEEARAIYTEANLSLSAVDNFDWSFDPSNTHQGKQWK